MEPLWRRRTGRCPGPGVVLVHHLGTVWPSHVTVAIYVTCAVWLCRLQAKPFRGNTAFLREADSARGVWGVDVSSVGDSSVLHVCLPAGVTCRVW